MNLQYIFKQPFNLTTQGTDHTIDNIMIPAPTARIVMCSVLENELNKCLMSIAKQRQTLEINEEEIREAEDIEDEKEVSKADQINYMLALGGADLRKCYDALKTCITQSKSMLNDTIKCTTVHFDEIPFKELQGLLGEYIANFINTLL